MPADSAPVRPGFAATIACACLLALLSTGRAQTISYILPDAGAPGMNVYVEIIGPTDAFGNFGTDGFYGNNAGDSVRVVCDDPADSAKIVIGPLVVSWDGRMVSTQIFVNPDLRPNSDDWQAIDPTYIVPIRVVVGGNASNREFFYILDPTPAITASGGGVLGEGALGRRTRRGTMIVDGLTLDASRYTVSTLDNDPVTPGNQGYFPFVLLSRGPIVGTPGAEIDVSSPGKDGGPGGGGGGGNFCDFTGDGSDGGAGFTGGGRGGRNRSGNPFSSDEFRNPGPSTGPVINNTGGSLNGVPGGTADAYEASGGGTGHPFGLSGEGCIDGGNCNPSGGFGGGSGFRQTLGGGAGGYATAGAPGNAAAINGGLVHGNRELVPLAGGSGGASGNPQGVSVCSGEGGGGGGAIRIFAPTISNVVVRATGGPGQNRPNGPGGSGSGGGVSIEVKNVYTAGIVFAAGGTVSATGGAGRVRRDGQWNSIPVNPPTVSTYTGPSTDTSRTVPHSFVLTGTGNGERIDLYLKSASMPWTLLGSVSGVTWTFPVVLPGSDGRYYLVAAQQVPNSTTNFQYGQEPEWVLSQAAANLFEFRSVAVIAGATALRMHDIACESFAVDTVFVRNDGDATLTLDAARFALGTAGFTLLSPSMPAFVPRRDSIPLVVRFDAPGTGLALDTLILDNSDTARTRNPWRIALEARKDSAGIASDTDALDFGTVLLCVQRFAERTVTIRNTGTVTAVFFAPAITMNGCALVSPPAASFPLSVLPGDAFDAVLRYTPAGAGAADAGTATFRTDAASCDRELVVALSGRGDDAPAAASPPSLVFDTLFCPGDTNERTFVVRNTGTVAASLDGLSISNPRFTVTSPAFPAAIAPGDSVVVRVRFDAGPAGVETGTLRLVASPCGIPLAIDLAGDVERAALAAADVDFGLLQPGDFPAVRNVVVFNTGTTPIVVSAAAFGFPAPFTVLSGVPATIAPGDSAVIAVRFDDPGTDGAYRDTLSLGASVPCASIAAAVFGGRGTAALTLSIDTASGPPGAEIDIPVRMRASTNPTLFGATGIRTVLRFNRHVLYPLFGPTGTVDGDDRVIALDLPLVPQTQDILAVLPFRAMLGTVESTVLGLDSSTGIGGRLAVTELPGAFTLTGVCREGGTRLYDGSVRVTLRQNRPNPFNPTTDIDFTLVEDGPTRLAIFDRLGRLVALPVDAPLAAGAYSVRVDASRLPSGVYTYVLLTPTQALTRRMTVVK